MGQLIARSWSVRRITATAAIALLGACTASSGGDVGVRTPSRASQVTATQAACPAQVRLLPTRTATESSWGAAISDNGWVAGWVAEPEMKLRAVVWRGNTPPLDLGVDGVPADINEVGDIAIQGHGYGPNGFSAFLWKDGTLRRLPGTKSRPRVAVNGLNDHGVVVGFVFGGRTSSVRAAVWRNGRVRVLRHPSGGTRRDDYFGQDINNSGLVIGWRGSDPRISHWWRTGGRVGTLSRGDSDRGVAANVDDRGRVVGFVAGRSEDDPGGPNIKWRSVRSDPKKFLNRRFGVFALHPDSGYVVGSRDSRRAFLGHLSDARVTLLPNPPALGGFDAYSAQAFDVATGQNPLAPDGGVTVVGTAFFDSVEGSPNNRAVLWTCARSYR